MSGFVSNKLELRIDFEARGLHSPQGSGAQRCEPNQKRSFSWISHGGDKNSMKEFETTLENSCGLCLQSSVWDQRRSIPIRNSFSDGPAASTKIT